MASIRKEILLESRAEDVWDAVRDIGALHQRLVPGFVIDTRLEEGARIVTFGNGLVVRELIVDLDDQARRLVWAARGGRLTHHNASVQVFADGVIGWTSPSRSGQAGMGSVSLADVRRSGPGEAARQALQAIPASAPILLHFDVDVLQKRDMPAAYFPHTEGLSLSEGEELLGVLLRDPRIRVIEISEYASLRDLDQGWVSKLVHLLSEGLKR